MTTWGGREAVARYINEIAGEDVSHTTIAARINAEFPDAKLAGSLVGRWRAGKLDVSPGNLAAFARAYGENPVEAFVAAGMIELDEALHGLSGDAVRRLARIRERVETFSEPTRAPGPSSRSRTARVPRARG